MSGILLAGGKGARMGAFKPLMSFRGRPLIAYALGALAPCCDDLWVMAGPAHAAALSRVAMGARVLADPGEGPHVALRLGARLARHETVLVAPADAPFLATDTYAPLLAAGADVTYEVDGTPEPMVGCYQRAALRAFDGRALRELPARRIAASAAIAAQLRDLDTPEDVRGASSD